MQTKIKFTYQDYLLAPEDKHYELIEGDLMMTPSPIWEHQNVIGNLFRILDDYVLNRNLGKVVLAPLDVILSDETVVEPDLLYIAKERLNIVKDGYVRAAPDLVIEVLSPSSKNRDLEIKRKLYGKYGVREYWIVDSDAQTVEVTVLGETGLETLRVFPTGAKVQSLIFKELSFDPSQIF